MWPCTAQPLPIRFSEAFVAAKLAEALPVDALARGDVPREQMLQGAARHLIRVLSEEVDAIEAEVRAAIPEAKHIDLELEHLPAPVPAQPEVQPHAARQLS